MKFVKLEDIWEKDPEVQKVKLINERAAMLREIIATKEDKVEVRSYKAGFELTIDISLRKSFFIDTEKFEKGKSERGKGTLTKEEKRFFETLEEMIQNRNCNSVQKEQIDILYSFFSDLEIGIE